MVLNRLKKQLNTEELKIRSRVVLWLSISGIITMIVLLCDEKYKVETIWGMVPKGWGILCIIIYTIIQAYIITGKKKNLVLRIGWTGISGGMTMLGIKVLVSLYYKWDVILKKGWLEIRRIYSVEERYTIGVHWAEEISKEMTGGNYTLTKEAIRKIAEHNETMESLHNELQKGINELMLSDIMWSQIWSLLTVIGVYIVIEKLLF